MSNEAYKEGKGLEVGLEISTRIQDAPKPELMNIRNIRRAMDGW